VSPEVKITSPELASSFEIMLSQALSSPSFDSMPIE